MRDWFSMIHSFSFVCSFGDTLLLCKFSEQGAVRELADFHRRQTAWIMRSTLDLD